MKNYLNILAFAGILTLSACGGSEEPTQTTTTEQSTTQEQPAVASTQQIASSTPNQPAISSECTTAISADDTMKYNVSEISVKSSCKEFAIVLNHTGAQPKIAGGHNIVITKATDKDAVQSDGLAAGVNNDYIKPDDERIIASSKLIGGGEQDTTILPVSKLSKDTEYVFFCTFPGHGAMMKGNIKLVD